MVTTTGNSGAPPQNYLSTGYTLADSDETASQNNNDYGDHGVIPSDENTPLIINMSANGATDSSEKVLSCWERINPKRYYENMNSETQERVKKVALYSLLTLGTTAAIGTAPAIYGAIYSTSYPPYLYEVSYATSFAIANIFWGFVFCCPQNVMSGAANNGL